MYLIAYIVKNYAILATYLEVNIRCNLKMETVTPGAVPPSVPHLVKTICGFKAKDVFSADLNGNEYADIIGTFTIQQKVCV